MNDTNESGKGWVYPDPRWKPSKKNWLTDDNESTLGWVYPGPPEPLVALAVPVIDPTSEDVPIEITITAATGLDVIYTIDDTPPTLDNGTFIESPAIVNLTTPCTLRAVATNLTDISEEASGEYAIGPLIVMTPESGEVPLNIILTSADTANLIYTTDGTAPTLLNGTLVASPATIGLLEPSTVKAVATDGTRVFSINSSAFVYTGREGDPTLIPRLVSWYRSDLVDLTADIVSTWYDQSGGGIHATPDGTGLPAGGIGPTLVSDVINGHPALRFNGTNGFLITGYQNYNAPNIFFIVAKQSSKATVGTFLGSFGDTAMRIGCDTNGYYFIKALPTESHPEQDFTLTDATDHSGAFHNFESMWDLTSSTGWIDGTQTFTDTTPPVTMAVLPFGRDTYTDAYLTGDIVEIIRYYTASFHDFTVSDRKWIEAYLANRYNLPNRIAFTPGPMNIAGLAMWLNADDLALADGAEITTWTDSSGNGFSPIKGTTGPAFKTNILNGYPVARFAVGKWLIVSDVQVIQPCTVIFVSKATAANIISDHGPGGGFSTSILTMPAPDGLWINANADLKDGIDHTGAFHVFSVELNGASTNGYVDGALTITGNAGPSGFDKVAIGAYDQDGLGASLVGDIAELMMYRRVLTTHEREEIEAYLRVKYAIS